MFQQLNLSNTPKALKNLLWAVAILSLFCACFNHFFSGMPKEILELSWNGLYHYYIWQPISYIFLQPSEDGISFSFLITLAFRLFLLWQFGFSILTTVGRKAFFKLFLIAGVAAGFGSLAATYFMIGGSSIGIAGTLPVIYALMVCWAMLFPDFKLLLFFTLPLKGKWLALIFIGYNLLSDLSSGSFIQFTGCLTGVVVGYLYAVIAWQCKSPFEATWKMDRTLMRWVINLRRFKKPIIKKSSKVVDIKDARLMSDNEL